MRKTELKEAFFDQVIGRMLKNRSVHGAILCIESGDKTISWLGARGNLQKDDQYFIASVTKLYVTALVLRLRADNRLKLEDKISVHLDDELVSGLHVLGGVDHTNDITVAHLLSNTSGIPDYFSYKQENGKKVESDLFGGKDEAWPLERILETAKRMKPGFRPGQKGKAHYSDTNYELLGRIIENVTGMGIAEAFQTYLFNELNLTKSYAFHDVHDRTPVPMYYKYQKLHLPKYKASITAEGGIVATAQETMAVLKGFFEGRFFPVEMIGELKHWHFIYYPAQLYFGMGLEKLWIPRIISPLKPVSEVLGFWGHSGAFAFHHPETDLYFTGTVNQLSGLGHSAAYNAMIRIIKKVT